MSGGKWNGMMTQKHIGYTSWNDNFPADRLPECFRITDSVAGGYHDSYLYMDESLCVRETLEKAAG